MESKNLAEEVVHNEPVIIIFPDIGMYSHIVDSRLPPTPASVLPPVSQFEYIRQGVESALPHAESR